jgi:hypothetical protein
MRISKSALFNNSLKSILTKMVLARTNYIFATYIGSISSPSCNFKDSAQIGRSEINLIFYWKQRSNKPNYLCWYDFLFNIMLKIHFLKKILLTLETNIQTSKTKLLDTIHIHNSTLLVPKFFFHLILLSFSSSYSPWIENYSTFHFFSTLFSFSHWYIHSFTGVSFKKYR